MYRVAKLSVPSTIRSYCAKISSTLSLDSASLWTTTFTYGLISRTESRADPGRGQIHQRGRAETARAHAQHLRVFEALLPGHPDVGDDQVARVAPHLVDGEFGSGLDERWQGHGCAFPSMEASPSANSAPPRRIPGVSPATLPVMRDGYGIAGPAYRSPLMNGHGLATQPLSPSVCCCITGAGRPAPVHASWPWPSSCPTSWLIA